MIATNASSQHVSQAGKIISDKDPLETSGNEKTGSFKKILSSFLYCRLSTYSYIVINKRTRLERNQGGSQPIL